MTDVNQNLTEETILSEPKSQLQKGKTSRPRSSFGPFPRSFDSKVRLVEEC